MPTTHSAQRVSDLWLPPAKIEVGDAVRIIGTAPHGLYRLPAHLRDKIGIVRNIRGDDGCLIQNGRKPAADTAGERTYTIDIPIRSVWPNADIAFTDRLRVEIGEPWLVRIGVRDTLVIDRLSRPEPIPTFLSLLPGDAARSDKTRG